MKFAYKVDGTVTGLNRAGQGEELTGTCTPQDLSVHPPHTTDVRMYTCPNGVLTPKTQVEIEALLANEKSGKLLKETQEARENAFTSKFLADSEAPVEVTIAEGTFTFNGGQDSAMAIDGAVRLATRLGEVGVYITDIDNIPRSLSFDSAMEVATEVGKAWRDSFYIFQAAKVAHDALVANGE